MGSLNGEQFPVATCWLKLEFLGDKESMSVHSTGVYIGGAFGGDRHHWHSRRLALASRSGRQGGSSTNELF